MWKWLAVAALVYGLLGLGVVLVPSPRAPSVMAQDWQAMLRSLEQEPIPGGPPGSGLPPVKPGMPPSPEPPQVLDFEQPQPLFATRPGQQAEVAQQPDGNHFLRWKPAPGRERFAVLIVPWRPAKREASALTLRLRADHVTQVIIGLREGDGSVYSVERSTTLEWRELVLPLNELHLGPRYTDENGKLDLDQVQELIIVHFARWQEREPATAAPNTVELDDIRLR